jgi:hypothetical protein
VKPGLRVTYFFGASAGFAASAAGAAGAAAVAAAGAAAASAGFAASVLAVVAAVEAAAASVLAAPASAALSAGLLQAATVRLRAAIAAKVMMRISGFLSLAPQSRGVFDSWGDCRWHTPQLRTEARSCTEVARFLCLMVAPDQAHKFALDRHLIRAKDTSFVGGVCRLQRDRCALTAQTL